MHEGPDNAPSLRINDEYFQVVANCLKWAPITCSVDLFCSLQGAGSIYKQDPVHTNNHIWAAW